jgi:MinD-like ATPase involved in chromosome partitioning or flagellar assembly
MSNHTMPEWAYKTLRNDDLRVYENSNGKVIISQVNERYREEIMTPQAIIAFLRSIKKKPVVMHPNDPFMGRHVPKRDVIAVLSERSKAISKKD